MRTGNPVTVASNVVPSLNLIPERSLIVTVFPFFEILGRLAASCGTISRFLLMS